MSRATALGLTGAAAGALVGLPQTAHADTPLRQGGTLRIQQNVKALKDPRSYDWSELGNQTRGFLEYLVEYEGDGSFRGMLLDNWEVNADATRYTLNLRKGVVWQNGDAVTAADVARNITRWCDSDFPGNSMASRFVGLIDDATGQVRSDAVQIVDDHTIVLTLSAPDVTLIANMSDYPAAIVHANYTDEDPFEAGIGTGPFRPVTLAVGEKCVLERHPDHDWWGSAVYGGPYLDQVEFVDYGTDPSNWVAAAESGDVDLLYETVGDFVDVMDAQGWVKSGRTPPRLASFAPTNWPRSRARRPTPMSGCARHLPWQLKMKSASSWAIPGVALWLPITTSAPSTPLMPTLAPPSMTRLRPKH